jgi:hypothetical protein
MWAGQPLSFMLAWPVLGAGQSGEDQRVAMSLALHVDVSATTVVGAPLGGSPHAPAGKCETGVPSLAACRSVSELNCRTGRRAVQGVDALKKLLSWRGGISCADAEFWQCRIWDLAS